MSSINLYGRNLLFKTTGSDLQEMFAAFGHFERAKIITDRYLRWLKGFGFVEMSRRSKGEQAMAELKGKEVYDRRIKVDEAESRSDKRREESLRGRGRY